MNFFSKNFKQLIIAFFVVLSVNLLAQPNWTPVIYTNTTTATGAVTIDGVAAGSGDMVGAFVGTECRASGTVFVNAGTAYISFLIQGETVETVSFKVWDSSADQILDVPYTTQTNPGGIIGAFPNVLPIDAFTPVSQFGVVVTITDVLCNGDATGAIDLTVTGGTQPYSFFWSNISASEDISMVTAGTYYVTITENDGTQHTYDYTVNEPSLLDISYSSIDASDSSALDGSIDITVTGGSQPYSYIWSNMEITEDLNNLSPGTYSVTVTDANGCDIFESILIGYTQSNMFNWNYSLTGIMHTILIPSFALVTIDGVQISQGDYVGVFYDDNGTLKCGGYSEYHAGINFPITAWGDDAETLEKDGFEAGEEFIWKLWRNSDTLEIEAVPYYMTTMANQGNFTANGISGIDSLIAVTVEWQYYDIPAGWTYFSTYIDLFEPYLDSIFSPFIQEVVIAKDHYGNTYWPAWNINMIGDMQIGMGYQVKMLSQQSIEFEGLAVEPENTPVSIDQGWSIIGYLCQSPMDMSVALSSIINDLVIVKSSYGGTYWPDWNINTIGNAIPGEGYLIKANSQTTLTYPANSQSFSKSKIETPKLNHTIKNTGSNMSLMIPNTAWENKPEFGSNILVYSEKGLLVGAGVYQSKNTAITIWGNDETTNEVDGLLDGEELLIKLSSESKENVLNINKWFEGDGNYLKNKISVVSSILSEKIVLLNQNTPNPFSNETEFSFYLPKQTKVEFSILNLLGEKVETILSKEMESGEHKIYFESKHLQSGIYFYNLKTNDFEESRKMIIVE